MIQDELAEHLLKGMLKTGGRVMVTREGDEIKIESFIKLFIGIYALRIGGVGQWL